MKCKKKVEEENSITKINRGYFEEWKFLNVLYMLPLSRKWTYTLCDKCVTRMYTTKTIHFHLIVASNAVCSDIIN